MVVEATLFSSVCLPSTISPSAYNTAILFELSDTSKSN